MKTRCLMFGMVTVLGALCYVVTAWSQQSGSNGPKVKVFITSRGRGRPQTAEIIKTFNERCAEVTVTMKRTSANYVVLLEREANKSDVARDNKVVVFNKGGDAIFSASTRTLGNSVQDACDAIRKQAQN